MRSLKKASVFVFTFCLGLSSAFAAEGVEATSSETKALWDALEQAHMQAKTTSYKGMLTTKTGSDLLNTRLKHFYHEGNEYESIELLDGQPTHWVRKNDKIQCVLPERKMIIDDRRHMAVSFPRLITPSERELTLSTIYDIAELPPVRVASRAARVLALSPKDDYRYSYQLFLDRDKGLLLKSQLIDGQGNVLEQVGFTEIQFDVDLGQRPEMLTAGPGWRTSRVNTHVVGVDHMNFSLPDEHLGFAKVQSLCKSKSLNEEVHQTVFTDGLSTVSIFVQETREGLALPDAPLIHGAVMSITKLDNGHLVTAIGEVPQKTLESFLSALSWPSRQ